MFLYADKANAVKDVILLSINHHNHKTFLCLKHATGSFRGSGVHQSTLQGLLSAGFYYSKSLFYAIFLLGKLRCLLLLTQSTTTQSAFYSNVHVTPPRTN